MPPRTPTPPLDAPADTHSPRGLPLTEALAETPTNGFSLTDTELANGNSLTDTHLGVLENRKANRERACERRQPPRRLGRGGQDLAQGWRRFTHTPENLILQNLRKFVLFVAKISDP